MKHLLFFLVLAIPVQIFSQDVGQKEWLRVSSPKGEVTLSIPSDLLVDNDGPHIQILGGEAGSSFRFSTTKGSNPRQRLRLTRNNLHEADSAEVSQFKVGKFNVDVYIRRKSKYSVSFLIASDKGFHSIAAMAKTADDPVLVRFLNSVRLDGQPLIKQAAPTVYSETPVRIDKMESSPIVKQALRAPDAKKVTVTYDSNAPVLESDAEITRNVVVLRKPQARYSSTARDDGVEGEVLLKVQCRADGTIGNIIVIKDLRSGLTELAIGAAKAIKFVPAENEGKLVDRYVTVSYTFDIL